MKKLVFATRIMQDQPFTVAGRTFYSRLITSSEELQLTELNGLATVTPRRSAVLQQETEFMAAFLTRRVRDSDPITAAWVAHEFGTQASLNILAYLRTGDRVLKQSDFASLVFDEPIEIEDRKFQARATTYAEQMQAAAIIEAAQGEVSDLLEEPDNFEGLTSYSAAQDLMREKFGEVRAVANASFESLALLLEARRFDGDPIDATWLQDRLQTADVSVIAEYLRSGTVPEEADPNAEAPAES